jgi:glyoxylase-like metal-dependent hydrolase (beta-lactamase superfamily II)
MEALIPDLYASAAQPLPFAPAMAMRSFLCRREQGNLLIYGTGGLEAEAAAIERIGGVSRHYLNHGHEAEFVTEAPASQTFIHRDDIEALAGKVSAAEGFSRRHMLDDDFEVIPTPGHTPGATAYLWRTGERRVLFTGDTIYLSKGEWVAAVLESSDRESYAASLELIRELDFDVLVPWIATAGNPYHALTSAADARRRIDAILERVRRREHH